MSNYPPGVTGMEYEISGPDYEETEAKDCDNQQCLYVSAALVRDLIATVAQRLQVASQGGTLGADVAQKMATLSLDDLNAFVLALPDDEVEYPCEWSGDVDVQGYQGQKWWTCPRCGTEHTEEIEDEGPDDERI